MSTIKAAGPDTDAAIGVYASCSSPEQFTTTANRWLEDNPGRSQLPQSHYALLREAGLKRCPSCATVKKLTDFGRHGDRLESRCKPCHTARHKAWTTANPDVARHRSRSSSAKYRAAHPWQNKLFNGYQRAIKRGAPAVRVSEAELLAYWESKGIDPNVSAFSGEPLTNENRSLDHLDPLEREGTIGHCVHNLFPCTKTENFSKKAAHPVRTLAKIRREKKR